MTIFSLGILEFQYLNIRNKTLTQITQNVGRIFVQLPCMEISVPVLLDFEMNVYISIFVMNNVRYFLISILKRKLIRQMQYGQ